MTLDAGVDSTQADSSNDALQDALPDGGNASGDPGAVDDAGSEAGILTSLVLKLKSGARWDVDVQRPMRLPSGRPELQAWRRQ